MKKIPIPTPVIQKVPIYKRIPVPIRKRECCGGKTQVVNNTNINIVDSESSESEEEPQVVRYQKPLIEYKRNYERVLDNDGFYHASQRDR